MVAKIATDKIEKKLEVPLCKFGLERPAQARAFKKRQPPSARLSPKLPNARWK
jgi:ubiquitin